MDSMENNAVTSVTTYVGPEKVLMFVCLSACDSTMVAEVIRFTCNLVQIFMSYAKLTVQFLA